MGRYLWIGFFATILIVIVVFMYLQFSVFLAGPLAPDDTPALATQSEAALVETVTVDIYRTDPLFEAVVTVMGILPTTCSKLGRVRTSNGSQTYRYAIEADTPVELPSGCREKPTPFTENIPLNSLAPLALGTYTIIANNASTTFTLPVPEVTETIATSTETVTSTPPGIE